MRPGKTLGLIVQMRIDSSRLPGKALLELGDTNLAGMVMRRLRTIEADHYILATDRDGALQLASSALDAGFTVFEGPKDDVLGRFALAIEAFSLDTVLRATGDNPFVSKHLADMAIAASQELDADYTGLTGMPVGMGIEVVQASALLNSASLARTEHEREHVCPYLYEHPRAFKIARLPCPAEYHMPEGRLTVDTAEDYRRAKNIVAALGVNPGDVELISWLHAERKDG
ncbi:MAG: NTP transferase domain-containing protein [Spirochaetia bacterium]|nr:NTP transferase domain-containing protein [Spirochaetia bacterium]